MRFEELTNAEQAKVRRLLKDQLASVDAQPFPRLRRLLADPSDAAVEPELLDEIRRLWACLDTAWSSDFELPAWLVYRVENDRNRYLASDSELGDVPDDSVDRAHLVRRIHHQRLALRALQRATESTWRWRLNEQDAQQAWLERQLRIAEDPDGDGGDVAELRKRLRLQTEARRRAERIIERQQVELCELLDRVVRQAATG